MNIFAIVPVNKLSEAKSRLSHVLTPVERKALVICMLKDVLDALKNLKIIIISPEPSIGNLKGYRYDFLLEKEKKDLNEAVKVATKYAIKKKAEATLFVPADIPLISPYIIQEILSLGKIHPLIISPAKRNGTGILFRRPPDIIEEKFTSNSFLDHLEEAKSKNITPYIYESPRISLDLDTQEDLEEFIQIGRGTRTYDFLVERII
jgi:2-phospho-L-lactate guanylyltransferase